jgi:plastocyanin
MRRRRVLATVGAALASPGCLGRRTGSDGAAGDTSASDDAAPDADATVSVGPGGSRRFAPVETTVDRGDTVAWTFDAGGHNVSGDPAAHPTVAIPAAATPFASYDRSGDVVDHLSLDPVGSTYRHTFETAGEYTYVCVPHASGGMIGRLTVR